MKAIYSIIPLPFLLGACATTAISDITFPEPTVITGYVQEIDDEGFVLKDDSGAIEIDTDGVSFENKMQVGDQITVRGVLDEDDSVGRDYIVAEEFDAYSVILSSGEEEVIVPYRARR